MTLSHRVLLITTGKSIQQNENSERESENTSIEITHAKRKHCGGLVNFSPTHTARLSSLTCVTVAELLRHLAAHTFVSGIFCGVYFCL